MRSHARREISRQTQASMTSRISLTVLEICIIRKALRTEGPTDTNIHRNASTHLKQTCLSRFCFYVLEFGPFLSFKLQVLPKFLVTIMIRLSCFVPLLGNAAPRPKKKILSGAVKITRTDKQNKPLQ
jgi:hypothetical protein